MSDAAWQTFSLLAVLLAIAIYIYQSVAMFGLGMMRLPYATWLRRAWNVRFAGLLLVAGGVLLLLFGPRAAHGTAEALLWGGGANVLVAAVNGLRVGIAVRAARRKMNEAEAEEGGRG